MFKPCPNCGFLVALIAGREASQRCPRCGSGLVEPEDISPASAADDTAPRCADAATAASPGAHPAAAPHARAAAADDPQARREPERSAHHPTASRGGDLPAASRQAAPTRGPAARHDEALPLDRGALSDTRFDAGPRQEIAGASGRARHADDADAIPSGLPAVDRPVEHDAPSADPVRDSRGDDAPREAHASDAPTFARRRDARRASGRRWPWWAAVAGLALLLALQLLLAQRRELAADARWRPVVARICPLFGCSLPPWREPAAYAMLARNVRPHPARPEVLRASTTVRNDAKWPQPLPVVVLSLSDLDGRIVGTRAVPPRDYSRTPDALVTPGTSVDIAFDVREPAGRVVSFDFRLQ